MLMSTTTTATIPNMMERPHVLLPIPPPPPTTTAHFPVRGMAVLDKKSRAGLPVLLLAVEDVGGNKPEPTNLKALWGGDDGKDVAPTFPEKGKLQWKGSLDNVENMYQPWNDLRELWKDTTPRNFVLTKDVLDKIHAFNARWATPGLVVIKNPPAVEEESRIVTTPMTQKYPPPPLTSNHSEQRTAATTTSKPAVPIRQPYHHSPIRYVPPPVVSPNAKIESHVKPVVPRDEESSPWKKQQQPIITSTATKRAVTTTTVSSPPTAKPLPFSLPQSYSKRIPSSTVLGLRPSPFTTHPPTTPPPTTKRFQQHDDEENIFNDVGFKSSSTITPPPPTLASLSIHRRGIRNVGNSCYSNAVLQSLGSERSLFRDLSGPFWTLFLTEATPVTNTLLETLRACREGGVVDPMRLKTVLPKFSGFRQEDAHEYLVGLVSVVERELLHDKKAVIEHAMQTWPQFIQVAATKSRQEQQEEISQLVLPFQSFYSTIENSLTCESCNMTRWKRERYLFHSLDFVTIKTTLVNLTDLISENLGQTSRLEYRCDNPQFTCSGTWARVTPQISSLPECLIFHLKRFIVDTTVTNVDGNPTTRKRHDLVNIPMYFVPSEWVQVAPAATRHVLPNAPKSSGPVMYHLRSIVAHVGQTAFGGHYVTYVRMGEGDEWVLFDDNHVTSLGRMDDISVLDEVRRRAYLVFYDRMVEL